MKKDVKIMVGCRIEPDLKEVLEAEAMQTTKTLSAYLEGILKQRNLAGEDVEQLKERIFELEIQNAAMESQRQKSAENENIMGNTAEMEAKMLAQEVEIRTLKQQKMTVTDSYKRAVEERNVLAKLQGNARPHWMSQETYNRMVKYLKRLKEKRPHLTHEQLLIVSLGASDHNESSLVVYRIADFLKSNPNFFTTQKVQNQ